MGSPVLDSAVSWIECEFDDIREAGDHYIVLGRVREFVVERSTLPLLFFQGGYGRFSPGSFVATPDPELIQAAQLAETIRSRVEDLSAEFSVNCSVLAKIRWDAVQVLAANESSVAEPFPSVTGNRSSRRSERCSWPTRRWPTSRSGWRAPQTTVRTAAL